MDIGQVNSPMPGRKPSLEQFGNLNPKESLFSFRDLTPFTGNFRGGTTQFHQEPLSADKTAALYDFCSEHDHRGNFFEGLASGFGILGSNSKAGSERLEQEPYTSIK